jgi:hypothetical protein
MFFIRATETNFYSKICCKRRNKKIKRDSILIEESINEDNFFDKSEPLTALISKNMNLEFMCCILFGLTEIFMKPERKKMTYDETVFNREFSTQDRSYSLLNEYSSKDFKQRDFSSNKEHKINYTKIFNDIIDLDNIEVHISSWDKKESFDELESLYETSKDAINEVDFVKPKKGKRHDAKVIEHCPRIFRELRRLDNITGYTLDS